VNKFIYSVTITTATPSARMTWVSRVEVEVVNPGNLVKMETPRPY